MRKCFDHWRDDRLSLTLADLLDERAPLLDELRAQPAFQRSLELRSAAPDIAEVLSPYDTTAARMRAWIDAERG